MALYLIPLFYFARGIIGECSFENNYMLVTILVAGGYGLGPSIDYASSHCSMDESFY